MQVQYQAYLLRLWREEAESQVEWHSHVDHIQSGRRMSFDTLEHLLDFLRQQTEYPTTGARVVDSLHASAKIAGRND